jgi:hypothetical protein
MRDGVMSRRTIVAAAVCIAVMFVAGIALIETMTGAPRVDAPSMREAGEVASAPLPAPSRGGGRLEREVVARAPGPEPVTQLPGGSPETGAATPAARAPGSIKISFKQDPRITKSLHMGTRWVSPPTYVGTHASGLFTVQARADGVTGGRRITNPTWSPAEPDMVAVTPDQGREVEIAVLREGRSTLTVSEGGVNKTVTVNAVERAGSWQIDISQ